MQDAARMPILAGAILFLLGLIEGCWSSPSSIRAWRCRRI